QVDEELDNEHEGRQKDHRTEEVLQVLETMLARAGDVVGDESDRAERKGDVEVGGGWREARNEPDQVGDEDENEEAAEQRHVALGVVPDHALGQATDELDE